MARYCLGGWNGFDSNPDYATLADAAEAIRLAEGWAEVHLSKPTFETECSIPVFHAYPTAEELGADHEWRRAPCIWEM
jgi:hypothetical protein